MFQKPGILFLVVALPYLLSCSGAVRPTQETTTTVRSLDATIPADAQCKTDPVRLQKATQIVINRVRAQARQCGLHTFTAAAPLSISNRLSAAAKVHTLDMVENNFFSHVGSDNNTASNRVIKSDYNWSHVGENLATGQNSVQVVVEDWIESAGHCANLMSQDFTELGVHCTTSKSSSQRTYWAVVFASPL